MRLRLQKKIDYLCDKFNRPLSKLLGGAAHHTKEMTLKDSLEDLARKAEAIKDSLQTEEATKHSLVLPFISILGYDIFNPTEVIPELDADPTKAKGEKVDYAICKDSKPLILIECKHWKEDPAAHVDQMRRYFQAQLVKFGVVTNGFKYLFFTDTAKENVMDGSPFLVLDLDSLTQRSVDELEKFTKGRFNPDSIRASADRLLYRKELLDAFAAEYDSPSEEFVGLLGRRVYHGGAFTKAVRSQFSVMVRDAFHEFVEGLIKARFEAAQKGGEDAGDGNGDDAADNETDEPEVVTTELEITGYQIVRAIVADVLPPERVTYRDHLHYFSVLVDDKIGQPLCQLHFNREKRLKVRFQTNGRWDEERISISKVEDIYKYASRLRETAERYR